MIRAKDRLIKALAKEISGVDFYEISEAVGGSVISFNFEDRDGAIWLEKEDLEYFDSCSSGKFVDGEDLVAENDKIYGDVSAGKKYFSPIIKKPRKYSDGSRSLDLFFASGGSF